MTHSDSSEGALRKYNTPAKRIRVTTTPKKTCLKDLSRATSRRSGTHVTAGQLALALTPYAQVTDLAVNTAASGNNAAAIQSLHDRVTAGRRLRPSIAALQSSLTTGLQQGRPVGLRRAGGRGGH